MNTENTMTMTMTTAQAVEVPEVIHATDEQKAIWKYMADWRNGHLIVEAGAGVGKTYTMTQGLAKMSRGVPIINLCFNTKIDVEMRKRLAAVGAGDVHNRTYNSMGAMVLHKAFPEIKLRKKKLFWTVSDVLGDSVKWATKLAVIKAVGLAKSYYVRIGDTERIGELCERHQVQLPKTKKVQDKLFEAVWETIKRGLEDTTGCDHDDQIYMPLMLDLPFPKYRLIGIDEAQDTNAMQWEMVERMMGPKTRVLAVGDQNQACYGFRGAGIDAIADIRKRLIELSGEDRVRVLTLTETQRCPLAVVKAANSIVPTLRASKRASMGMVSTRSSTQMHRQIATGDLVMCRTNAPLIEQALRTMVAGKRVKVQGRDEVGRNVEALIRQLAPANMRDLLERLDEWFNVQKSGLNYLTQQQELEALQDRYQTLRILTEGLNTLQALQDRIDTLFADYTASDQPSDVVLFSSIHRAKGLEAPICWILKPELIPHPKAEQDWERQQERNLAYIAITRCKFLSRNTDAYQSGRVYFVDGPVPPIYGSEYLKFQKSAPENMNKPTLNTDIAPGELDVKPTAKRVQRLVFTD